MPLTFPSSPSVNDTYTDGARTWQWNGTSWKIVTGALGTGSVGSTELADGSIVNADINAAAAIALSKLATSTAGNIIVYNASGVPTSVAESGDITIDSSGVASIASGVIVDADVNAAAAIAISKLGTSTTSPLGVGSIELGHANDTTLARSAAGVVTIEGVNVVTTSSTDTLTNKTLTSPTINGVHTNLTKELIVQGLEERVNVVASAATGTINIDVATSSIWYYTSNATANHTLNFRYNSGTSLSSKLAVGDSITIVWMNTNGTTAYYPNVIQIDGSAVTPKVPSAISSGNASSIDVYSFTIVKTAATPTYTVLETQTKFA